MAEDISRKRLGRGLAALIGEIESPPASDDRDRSIPAADQTVPIELIRANAFNPRRKFEESELSDLANSILQHGIVQPILVRPVKDQSVDIKYEIIAGERRWRAAQRAGLHTVPVIIREAEDRLALELAIVENIQRSDLNAIEEALGFQKLINDYAYSQAELGQILGKSRSHVANMLRLLKLPENVQSLVISGEISAGHARALITAENPESLAHKIMTEGLSVRQAELLGQAPEENPGKSASRQNTEKSADLRALERQMSDLLGLAVNIVHRHNGSGKLTISYSTIDQLDAVCEKLQNG
jgi:ParB family transcriptional regulator, chromosome partitioning protein